MYPISSDLVRAMDDERRRTLRRHVRRRRRQRADDGPHPQGGQAHLWADDSGAAHVVDRDGVARLEGEARRAGARRS